VQNRHHGAGHVPEVFASAGKDTKGRPVSKPLARPETRVKPALIAGIAGAALLVVIIAFALRGVSNKVPLVAVGLLVVSPPLVLGGYTFLRDDDKLDPYVGRELWTRVLICSAGYALLWAAYMPLSSYITGEMWQWMFIAPVFISIGGGIALACFDLDFGAGSLHYSFYVLVTLLLRAALGIAPIWTPVTSGM